MITRGDLILLDTSAIIEANKLKFWNALEKGFQLETVRKCIDEIKAGNFRGGTRLNIDVNRLAKGIVIRDVNREILTTAVLASDGKLGHVDLGERDLIAYAFSRPEGAFFISAQDKACIRVGGVLGLLERFISLEEMAITVGVRTPLELQFTKRWLSSMKTQFRLGTL
jgi:hypothetical protein